MIDWKALPPAEVLIASEGNLPLAAERAGHGQNIAAYIASFTEDDVKALVRGARVFNIISSLETMFIARRTLANKMDDLPPTELARFYNRLSTDLAAMSDPREQTINHNLNDNRPREIPPEIEEALRIVRANVVDGEPPVIDDE